MIERGLLAFQLFGVGGLVILMPMSLWLAFITLVEPAGWSIYCAIPLAVAVAGTFVWVACRTTSRWLFLLVPPIALALIWPLAYMFAVLAPTSESSHFVEHIPDWDPTILLVTGGIFLLVATVVCGIIRPDSRL